MNLDEFNISNNDTFWFPLGELGTLALFKLPTLWWGTYVFKMKSYLLEL